MIISIIGAGNMGAGLAKQLTAAGHRVQVTSRDPAKAQALASAHPGARVVSAADVAQDASVIIIATGYADAETALKTLGSLDGRLVIDITNPLTADYMGLTIGHDTSAAEQIANAIPSAHVVKAFNTVLAQVLTQGASFANDQIVPVFYAGDDQQAKSTVREIVESIGFKPIDAGSLKNARYLEPMAGLNIYFAYGAGQGSTISPTWISRD